MFHCLRLATDHDRLQRDLGLFLYIYGQLPFVIGLYCCMFATTLFPFTLIKLHQSYPNKCCDLLVKLLFSFYIITMIPIVIFAQMPFGLSPAMKFAYFAALIIGGGKLILCFYDCTKAGATDEGQFLTLSHYLYFMSIPVVVFRYEYPQTKSRDWKKIVALWLEFALVIIVVTYLMTSFWMTQLSNYGLVPLTISYFAETMCYAICVAVVFLFAMHYAVLHLWLNIWAEVTQFADRR